MLKIWLVIGLIYQKAQSENESLLAFRQISTYSKQSVFSRTIAIAVTSFYAAAIFSDIFHTQHPVFQNQTHPLKFSGSNPFTCNRTLASWQVGCGVFNVCLICKLRSIFYPVHYFVTQCSNNISPVIWTCLK